MYVELRAGSPAYIRLQESDYLQEGDAFHREDVEIESPTLATWTITPDTVVGRDVDSGEETTWEREAIETGLAVGRYSTALTDFETVSGYKVGSREDLESDADGAGTGDAGRPYVSVVAHGDNGRKYGRRYRFVEPGSAELELRTADEPRGGFDETVAERLDRRVRDALEAEGYAVTGSDDADG